MVKMIGIGMPDEIIIIGLISTSIRQLDFPRSVPGPEMIFLKDFLDVGSTDWIEMVVFWE
jgi:hypothetical protein